MTPTVANSPRPWLRLGLPFGLDYMPPNAPSPDCRLCFLLVYVLPVPRDCEPQKDRNHGPAAPCLAWGGHIADS